MSRRTTLAALGIAASAVWAQDLAPRAYVITPMGANAITLSESFSTGSVFADPSVSVEDARARFQTQTISYYRSVAMWGRSSNITLLVPYIVGNVRAVVIGQNQQAYRSGLADSRIRWAVNLRGGPAVLPRDFRSWRESNLIGFSVTAIVPTGQFEAGRVINIGANRAAVKPESECRSAGSIGLLRPTHWRLVFRSQFHVLPRDQQQDTAAHRFGRDTFDLLLRTPVLDLAGWKFLGRRTVQHRWTPSIG